MDASEISSTPRGLKRLVITGISNHALPSQVSYPPDLESLHIHEYMIVNSVHSIMVLPRRLKLLHMFGILLPTSLIQHLPNSLINIYPRLQIGLGIDLSQAFPHLESLKADIFDFSSLQLPLRLTTLELNEDSRCPKSLVLNLFAQPGNLPPSITELHLRAYCRSHQKIQLSNLPSRLIKFYLQLIPLVTITNDILDMTSLQKLLQSLIVRSTFSHDYDPSFVMSLLKEWYIWS